MRADLLLVDLITTFEHEDGDALLASYRARHEGMRRALGDARQRGLPIVYANDHDGRWDGDAPGLVRRALDGKGGELVAPLAPAAGDRVVLKPRYSAFDHTPLVLILQELGVELLLLAGAATERCVVQTAIDARELGFKVTVVTRGLRDGERAARAARLGVPRGGGRRTTLTGSARESRNARRTLTGGEAAAACSRRARPLLRAPLPAPPPRRVPLRPP